MGRLDHKLESPTVGRSEQSVIAPETPIKCSTSIRSFESPENAKILTWMDKTCILLWKGRERSIFEQGSRIQSQSNE